MTGMSERKYRINLEVAVIYIIVSNLVFTMGKKNCLHVIKQYLASH